MLNRFDPTYWVKGLAHKGIISSDDFGELKLKGLEAYEAKDWDTAIRLLSEYLQKARPTDEETPDEINLVNLYVGRAWLEKSKPQKAIAALQKADAGITDFANYGLLQELIRWQLTLAHLKNKDPDAAKRTAQLLQNAQQPIIKDHASKLLKDLK